MSQQKISQILQFWFKKVDPKYGPSFDILWFQPSSEYDKHITEHFQKDVLESLEGKKLDWKKEKDGMMAYILLNDQFPRNIFRGCPQAFANDHLSLQATKEVLANREKYNQYYLLEKCFILLPLEHSEKMEDQNLMLKESE